MSAEMLRQSLDDVYKSDLVRQSKRASEARKRVKEFTGQNKSKERRRGVNKASTSQAPHDHTVANMRYLKFCAERRKIMSAQLKKIIDNNDRSAEDARQALKEYETVAKKKKRWDDILRHANRQKFYKQPDNEKSVFSEEYFEQFKGEMRAKAERRKNI